MKMIALWEAFMLKEERLSPTTIKQIMVLKLLGSKLFHLLSPLYLTRSQLPVAETC